MNLKKSLLLLASLLILSGGIINAQNPIESITQAEIRDHIFFLASDYMNGRVGISAEYHIAAQYVATQFAAAGLEPLIENKDGSKSYFQGVPFIRTTYSDKLVWKIRKDGKENTLAHKEDFKVMFGNSFNHDNIEIVYVGYGIEEPGHDWNDFRDLDVGGKIMVCISGAPLRKGKPVLPEEIHKKYAGPDGLQSRLYALFSKGAKGIILVDIDNSSGIPFDLIPGDFETEKYVYSEGNARRQQRSIPSIYLARPGIFDILMGDNKNNPLAEPENIIKNYKPQLLEGVFLTSKIEVLNEDLVYANNVVGLVPGTDPVLKNEYIVVGAHLDHVKPVQGQVCNGADDNASGSAGVIEIAEALAMKPCRRSVVFITWTAEEMGLIGSRHFVGSKVLPLEQMKFNLNMDMIGRSDPENKTTRAHYVVTDKKYLGELESLINDINKGITNFPLLFDNDEDSPGGSDHQSFINEGIPGFFFFSGVHEDLHQPGDDPEKIDYPKAESISRLAYLITEQLANMDAVPSFMSED